MYKKKYDKDFEFLLSRKQKNHLINKSNDLSISGAEYIRLLIEQDIILEELTMIKRKDTFLNQRLSIIQHNLNRYRSEKQ